MFRLISLALLLTGMSSAVHATCPDYLNVDLRVLRSDKTVNICEDHANKPMLIVNTASKCGFTPQFEGLEALHQQYKDDGLVVLGFPSDSFKQEIKNEEKVAEVCFINYGVTFTMLSPVDVRGDNAHQIFKELAKQSEQPGWNFNKYVLNKNGEVIRHFGSRVRPDSNEMVEVIKSAL